MDHQGDGLPSYNHIDSNEFAYRKHRKQKEEDIAVCVCQFDANDPDSACGETCLNVLTSTECTPGYCPCGVYCKNQKFQKCECPMLKLFKTEDRGWGLLADENIGAGQFVIEYCGEVISRKVAKRRSQAYEAQGLKDAYIISLNASESIDATKKGSLARFINHSCQPNCETRKSTVLGEIRVGIFAKQDIPAGTELSYDYNFEWYGGAKVRCLCGAACCSEFLGAKSRGFQEAFCLWEDDDTRYSVDDIPLYDSGEDESSSKLLKPTDSSTGERENDYYMRSGGLEYGDSHSTAIVVEPLNSMLMGDAVSDEVGTETGEDKMLCSPETNQFNHNAMMSCVQSNSACRNYHIEPSPSSKRFARYPNGKTKNIARKEINVKFIAERLASTDACRELLVFEEMTNEATSQLDTLYDEIRPAIEEHERDSQDSVPTSVAEKWIEASCCKLKADFDLHSAIIKNISCTARRGRSPVVTVGEGGENGIKYLEINL
uniref:Histone-lysine N-methyltransferase ASHH1 n=1 Tax=Anthurium amnicola TaxID=1678845 RepID=A0A1D1YKG6_9ARAE